MSYQIKSTPFFRRMLSTSKKNGQLQKLKEEYERMKDFNDRTIEMKMREVRLKRLFKDIEDIKELSYHLPKRSKILNRNKTAADIRVETFLKAKELGKEFSKLNGLLAPCTSKSSSKDQFPSSHLTQKDRKLLVQKAKNYGNDSSRANLVKISTQSRKIVSRKREIDITKEPDKHEILMQRLRYGNSRSHLNMAKIPRRDAKHNVATDQTTSNPNVDVLHRQSSIKSFKIPSPPNFCHLERKSSNNLQSSETFVQAKVSATHSMASSTIPTINNYEAHIRAKKYWRKVALTVLNRFDKAIRCATKVDDELFLDDNIDNEFILRTISNNTDLTSSTTITERKRRAAIEIGANEPEPNEENEVLLHVEPLYTPPTPMSGYATPICAAPTSLPVNTTTTSENQNNLLETINDLKEKVGFYEPPRPSSDKVQQLAKIFEPFVRDAAQKEAFDGVQKLKSIFESQSE